MRVEGHIAARNDSTAPSQASTPRRVNVLLAEAQYASAANRSDTNIKGQRRLTGSKGVSDGRGAGDDGAPSRISTRQNENRPIA